VIIFYLFNIFETSLFPGSFTSIKNLNPGYLLEKNREVSLGGEERFCLKELRTYFINFQSENYQVSLKSFGNELYRENQLEFSGGFSPVPKLGIGFGLALLNCSIKDNFSIFSYSLKTGIVYKSSPFESGLLFGNLNQPRFSEIDRLPFFYFFNSRYWVGKEIGLYFNIGGEEGSLPFFNFGLVLFPFKNLQISAGMNTENFLFEYNLRIPLGRISFDYSGNHHPQLGLSHCFIILFYP